jgi:hypothetical protein
VVPARHAAAADTLGPGPRPRGQAGATGLLQHRHHARDKAEAALDGALKERESATAAADLSAAMQRIGELTMENELLRARMERPSGPLARRRSR